MDKNDVYESGKGDAESRMRTALQKIAKGHDEYQSYSGSICAEIAEQALRGYPHAGSDAADRLESAESGERAADSQVESLKKQVDLLLKIHEAICGCESYENCPSYEARLDSCP